MEKINQNYFVEWKVLIFEKFEFHIFSYRFICLMRNIKKCHVIQYTIYSYKSKLISARFKLKIQNFWIHFWGKTETCWDGEFPSFAKKKNKITWKITDTIIYRYIIHIFTIQVIKPYMRSGNCLSYYKWTYVNNNIYSDSKCI